MNEVQNLKNRGARGKYLTYFLGEEQYGIEISQIKEIIAMMKITHVPRTPAYVSGVINLRGSIIPVIDTRLRFGMPPKEYEMHTAIIITEINKVSVGFVVDNVNEVASIDDEHLSEPPKFGTNIDTDFIKKMAQINDSVVMVMDLEKLFEADVLNMLGEIAKKEAA